ncbi:helix-turn-helix domain-containing protein [Oceanobacillus sp. J11TS1]|uniref:helix-turn-helix domain-containing protein n=1 Tax=Oceanobacillus sp. J11TS1 TaxID=2807191 RepID=UPI001B0B8C20|nr:helix-turn-helix transcriptional regulator [Oceanobacillus sp. J11TS1]GIO24282.1 HTH-type transcriptional regulator ImmR [Oceanobacillus sp. J11TS1]
MKILSQRLREAREQAGLKQIEASKLLGISNGTLSGYEREYRDPDTDTLHKMADLYGVSVDWLLGKSMYPSTKDTLQPEPMSEQDSLMFHNWKRMTEEEKQEALNVIQYILYKKKLNNKEDQD